MRPRSCLCSRTHARRRYYEAVERHGASTSRRAKLVLVGSGRAGKSSTLRGMKHGEPRPFADDERTVQLDIWNLALGDPPPSETDEDERIFLSAWDFAGQPEYAAGQQQYLVPGALCTPRTPRRHLGRRAADKTLVCPLRRPAVPCRGHALSPARRSRTRLPTRRTAGRPRARVQTCCSCRHTARLTTRRTKS